MEPSKRRWRISGLPAKREGQMAGAAESDPRSDLTHAEDGLGEEETLRNGDSPLQHVGVRGYAERLPERPLEVAGTEAGQLGEPVQRDRLRQVPLHVFLNRLEPMAAEAAEESRRGTRERRIGVQDVMGQKFRRAFRVELPEGEPFRTSNASRVRRVSTTGSRIRNCPTISTPAGERPQVSSMTRDR